MLSWPLGHSRTLHCPEPDSRAAPGIGIPRLSHQGHQGLCSQHKLHSCSIWSFPGLPPDPEPGPEEVNACLDKECLRVCLPVSPQASWLLPERLPLLLAPLPALLDWGSSTFLSKSHGLGAIRKEISPSQTWGLKCKNLGEKGLQVTLSTLTPVLF